MATPRNNSYTAASGAGIYAGMSAPSSLPAWLQGKPLNEWFQIPNTSLMQAAPGADAFNGMALVDDLGRAIAVLAAPGGHNDSDDNSVVAIDLMADAPAWGRRHAASVSTQPNVAYYADGLPASRHLYDSCHHIPALDRIMLLGYNGLYGNGAGGFEVCGFNLATDKWDGVVPDQPGTSGSGYANMLMPATMGCLNPLTGEVWSFGNYFNLYKWSPLTKTQTLVKSGFPTEFSPTMCWDPGRNQLVLIGFLGGDNGGGALNAFKVTPDGQTRTQLTFTNNADYAAWVAAAKGQSALVYDPIGDRFFWFNNSEGGGNRLYVITPNAGSNWDIRLHTQGPGTDAPPTGGFTYSKMKYVTALRGLVFFPAIKPQIRNGHFMRLHELG